MSNKGFTSRSWFITFNNPEEILTYETDSDGNYVRDKNNDLIIKTREPSEFSGLTPEEICERVLDLWCTNDTRAGAASFCISAKGLRHLHIIYQDAVPCRFSAIKALIPRAHLEPTRGSKKQAEDYISKVGSWAEKGEQVICIVRRGEISSIQGKRSDLNTITELLAEGLRPAEILAQDIKFLKNKELVKDAYFMKRDKETPVFREVKVYYHWGLTQTGKSHTRLELEEKNPGDVCFIMDYGNGFIDHYMGEKILFLDEFRGELPFTTFLTLLDGYKGFVHARNHNILKLWEEVHITTPLPPEALFQKMCYADTFEQDEQLLRRIDFVIYHYKDSNGFHCVNTPMAAYPGFRSQIMSINENKDGFVEFPEEEIQAVKELFSSD